MTDMQFWCHPLVTRALREEAWWTTSARSPLWNLYDLYACPVYEDVTMELGAWEFREGGRVVKAGNLWP